MALEKEGNEPWERFLIGAVIGIDAIHLLRKEEYFSAITQGFSAVGHIEKARIWHQTLWMPIWVMGCGCIGVP